MLKLIRLGALLPMIGTVACSTSLDVQKIKPGSAPMSNLVAYSLPFQQFDVTATRTYKGCKEGEEFPFMELKVSADPAVVPDPEHTYSIDPQSLAAFTKTSDLKISWVSTGGVSTALIQSFNASVDDRTGQIIVNTITGIASIATTIASGGVGAAGGKRTACRADPEMLKLLAKQKQLDARVEYLTNAMERATTRLNAVNALAGAGGSRLDWATSDLMVAANDTVKALTKQQKEVAKEAAKNQKLLTHTTSFRWPKNGTVDESNAQQVVIPDGFEAAQRFKMFDPSSTSSSAREKFSISLRLEPLPSGYSSAGRSEAKEEELLGLRYRVPVGGQLLVCSDEKRSSAGGGLVERIDGTVSRCGSVVEPADIIRSESLTPLWAGPVAQLGQIRSLPYSNGPFQNNTMAASFNPDGGLSSVQYTEKSRGETISAAFAEGAKAAGAGVKGIVLGPTNQTKAKVERLKAESDLVTQESNLPYNEQIGALVANTNLLKAQAAYADAQTALQKSTDALKASKP